MTVAGQLLSDIANGLEKEGIARALFGGKDFRRQQQHKTLPQPTLDVSEKL